MRNVLALTITVAFGMLSGGNSAHAASIKGTWAGNGFVQPRSGPRENVKCRVSYSQSSAKSFGLSAICTSKAGKTKSVRGSVVHHKGNSYAGRLSFAGTIRVTVSGNRQVVTVSSAMGSGRMHLVKR